MREIKFRAWYDNRMVVPACIGEFGEWYRTGLDYENGRGNKGDLMQFTGLKDKNGKEIYEGDIVRLSDEDDSEHEITVVRYLDGGFVIEWDNHFNGGDSDLTTVGWAGYDGCVIEVIGNIYENPELLNS